MARLQLALDVVDLEAAIDFYTKLFDTPVHKRRDGYANFAIADPPLKLVLFENANTAAPGTAINHLGVEVTSSDEVAATTARLAEAGLELRTSEAERCCHAIQDKVWAADPNGDAWEFYTILDDEPELTNGEDACATGGCATGEARPVAELPLVRTAPETAGCC